MKKSVDISKDLLTFDGAGGRVAGIAAVIGLLAIGVSVVLGLSVGAGGARFYFSYLVSFCYFLSIALGALFFVLIQHVTRAGWSVVVRRFAEAISMNVIPFALLFIPVILGMNHLYHWTHADAVAHDHLLAWKAPYLNTTFFIIRVAIYFVIWGLLARYFFSRSGLQDETGDWKITIRMQNWSAPGLVLFALTVTFFAFDCLMSLDPHWYSTIFGVYYFTGGAVGFFALLPIVTHLVQRSGRVTNAISPEHYHDMGKLVFAFVVFWAYIAFSQYMLIWYANIPEETVWFLKRQTGDWTKLSLFLLFGHFIIPFIMLISRWVKRRSGVLFVGAFWVLLVHWADIYWLVMPEMPSVRHGDVGQVPLHLLDLTCFIGLGGLFIAVMAWLLRKRALIPVKDPRLEESLAFENV